MTSGSLVTRIANKVWYVVDMDKRLQRWSDEKYLRLLYRVRMSRRLNIKSPESFSAKLQWLKLHDRNPLYTMLVDKFEVKKWVASKIGEEHVVSNYGVWETFDEIDFNALPERYVLKCTHDSGGLAICADPELFELSAARARIDESLSRNYFFSGREWPYKNVKPRILAEEYLDPLESADAGRNLVKSSTEGLIDYKFYCFHGEPQFLYVSQGLHDHRTAKMDFLDLDWNLTGFYRSDYRHFVELPAKPVRFDAMIAIARRLSKNIPFVRVDLFEHHGEIKFSEMTFHPVSGMMRVDPDAADLEIGQLLDLTAVGI